ncbi:hypothetical protein DFH27DRAFT_45812 [Peziza echinospora]|nr:hypothetical protein DFH27DRAFT_45812 [Peziza echinospora]
MHTTIYPAQSYYSPPQQTNYSFYYTQSGQYCAVDPLTGNNFIHNLSDNRWYPYSPNAVPAAQPAFKQTFAQSYNNSNGYQYASYDYSSHMNNGAGRTYEELERSKESKRSRERSREGEFLYSAAAAEAAQRSLIEDMDIVEEHVFEDEGLDMHTGERSSRFRRKSRERSRQRSRSMPNDDGNLRSPKYSPRQASRPRHVSRHQQPPPTPHYPTDNRGHRSYHREHGRFGSNYAGVGVEGSEHDSGYMDDFEPAPEPRRAMPGVARWLDDIGSDYSGGECMHPFGDASFHERCREGQDCKPRVETTRQGDLSWGRHAHHEQLASPHLTHHKVTRDSQHSRFGHSEVRGLPRDQSPVRYARHSKTLHRQDSGIDMGGPGMEKVEIEIDIDMESTSDMEMNDYPAPGCYPHGSPHPKFVNIRRHSQPRSPRKETVSLGEPFDCYYIIPPCPPGPPVVHHTAPQELARRHRGESPPSRHYNSPNMPPRAPSPPVSPAPARGHQRRSSFVPIVEHSRYERRYHSNGRW